MPLTERPRLRSCVTSVWEAWVIPGRFPGWPVAERLRRLSGERLGLRLSRGYPHDLARFRHDLFIPSVGEPSVLGGLGHAEDFEFVAVVEFEAAGVAVEVVGELSSLAGPSPLLRTLRLLI